MWNIFNSTKWVQTNIQIFIYLLNIYQVPKILTRMKQVTLILKFEKKQNKKKT